MRKSKRHIRRLRKVCELESNYAICCYTLAQCINAYDAVFGWGYIEMVEIMLDFLIRVASVGQYIKSMGD
jgi:hypothetical protein